MTETTKPLDLRASRRTVIAGAAAVAGAAGMSGLLPDGLAAAAAAEPATFSLDQIKHVVYVMQENRSFDHYFGTFPKARGFDDPTAMTLANGNSVFQQPDPANPDGYLEPFHMDTATTGAAAVPSLSHDWRDQHASWNNGAMDGWLHTHLASDGDAKGSFTMGYMEKEDIPFHWALAERFTLLDNYHCSVLGPTYPNRAIWMSGTNDPQGTQGGPILETVAPNTLTWTSAAEVLFNAGYTVKTYTSSGSYNYFSWWQNFKAKGLVPDELYNRIMVNGTLFGNGAGGVGDPLNPTKAATAYLGFEEDCANGTLADVTWLFPDGPYASDEHPPNTPAAGAYFLASKLEALAKSPTLWSSTVFIINYDENDGFFDHVPPPIPDPDTYPEEYVELASPKGTPGGGLPVGAGFRVPCLIISPWTVGGHIYSEVSDHTSPLRLIEAVTAAGGLDGGTPTNGLSAKKPVSFEAISPWRRATFDDFTGAFQGTPQSAPSDTEFDPDTRQANYQAQLAASSLPMPARPGATQTPPTQEPGTAGESTGGTSGGASGTGAPGGGSPDAGAGAGTSGTDTSATGTSDTAASGTTSSGTSTSTTKTSATSGAKAGASTAPASLRVETEVKAGTRAAVAVTGGRRGSAVVVRNSAGRAVARGRVGAGGRASVRIPARQLPPGRHRFAVTYTDRAGLAHTKHVTVTVVARAHRPKR